MALLFVAVINIISAISALVNGSEWWRLYAMGWLIFLGLYYIELSIVSVRKKINEISKNNP